MRKKHAERADGDLRNSTAAKSAQRASIYAFEVYTHADKLYCGGEAKPFLLSLIL